MGAVAQFAEPPIHVGGRKHFVSAKARRQSGGLLRLFPSDCEKLGLRQKRGRPFNPNHGEAILDYRA
jgi:hypothetical protein